MKAAERRQEWHRQALTGRRAATPAMALVEGGAIGAGMGVAAESPNMQQAEKRGSSIMRWRNCPPAPRQRYKRTAHALCTRVRREKGSGAASACAPRNPPPRCY